MNNLSWFLYLADILPTLFTPFVVLAVFIALIWGVMFLYFRGESTKHSWKNWMYGGEGGTKTYAEEYDKRSVRALKMFWTFVAVFAVTLFIQLLIPSRQTIYLIAGSEVGEMVVKTPEAKEIFNDIRTVIKQQIKDVTEVVK
jgi:hypothetical protein